MNKVLKIITGVALVAAAIFVPGFAAAAAFCASRRCMMLDAVVAGAGAGVVSVVFMAVISLASVADSAAFVSMSFVSEVVSVMAVTPLKGW